MNAKKTLKAMTQAMAVAGLVAAGTGSPAMAGDSSMFDIGVGAGAAYLGDDVPLEALFRVDLVVRGNSTFDSKFVIMRTDGEMTVGTEGVRYVDLNFDVAEWKVGAPDMWGSFTAVGVDVERNVPLNQDLSVRVSFLGLKGKIDFNPGDDAVVYVKGAADLLALGYMSSHYENSAASGYNTAFDLELGVKILKKVRISVGEDFQALLAKPRRVYSGYGCDTDVYYDDYGSYTYTECGDQYETVYDERRTVSNTRLSVVADITKNLQFFGRANYLIYSVRDNTGDNPNTTDSGFQFFLGLNGKF